MSVQSQTQKTRGRLPDLNPFDLGEPAAPPAITLSHSGREPPIEEPGVPDSELAYGCVEWFRYPRKGRRGDRSGTP